MKHPALVRVFAVILIILCLIMLCAGILGLQKAEEDYNRNIYSYEKMKADLEEYLRLLEENEGKEPYESANEALKELIEQHDETAAEHRTDLATYTATKGGIKTGVEALDQADAMMANAKAEFEKQKKEMKNMVEELKGLKTLAEAYEGLLAYQNSMYALTALPAIVIPPSVEENGQPLSGEDTDDDTTNNPPDGTTNNPPDGITNNPPDGTTNNPPDGTTNNPPDGTTNNPPDGTTNNPPDGTTNNPPDGTTNNPPDDTKDGEGSSGSGSSSSGDISAFYNRAIEAGQNALVYLSASEDTAMVAMAVNSVVTELQNAVSAEKMSPEHYNNCVAGLRQIGGPVGDGLSATIAGMKAQLDQLGSAMGMELSSKIIADYISQIETGLTEGEKQLTEAEKMLYDSRAQIWYEMGKLEKQEAELETLKDELLEEEQEIITKDQQTQEQKDREKRLRSLYLTFAEKDEVAAALENGEEFVSAVESYIDSFFENSDRDAKMRGFANILMIIAAPAALICMLASFEIIKKRAAIRGEAIIVLLCSSAALGIFLWLGRGVSYSAASVAAFAAIQFLVSGRVKRKA